MIHNLTDKQLRALRWLVKQVNEGRLEESFYVSNLVTDTELMGVSFYNDLEIPDHLDYGVLNALVADRVLIFRPDRNALYSGTYTLTRRAYEITTFDFDNPEPDTKRSYLKETLHLIPKYFEPDEFKAVCFDLSVNAEWELGDVKSWPLELLRYLYRQNRLHELPAVLREHRPGIDWPPYPGQERING